MLKKFIHRPLTAGRVIPAAVFLAALFTLPLSAQAGMKITVEENNGSLTIISSSGSTRELFIPETINNMPVTAIGQGAFTNKGLTSVTIPNSVTTIGEQAFSFNQLTSLTVGDSVTTIGQKAFFSNKLENVTLGQGLTEIGVGAFAENNIAEIVIPESVTTIGAYAFFFNKLKTLTIPNNVTALGEGAFSSNKLNTLVIGGAMVKVGDGAFYNNQLFDITIPPSVTEMGKQVFESRTTQKSSKAPVDYLDDKGDVIYTTANNFDAFYKSNGSKSGKYSFSPQDGWKFEDSASDGVR
ncbi:MAG: leucine-rich repeat domain-containing protein [Treponema sp.]|jgi:hypothetical protein|nr:leucine-rich repeat domain-containing protein [Treponema sp.]